MGSPANEPERNALYESSATAVDSPVHSLSPLMRSPSTSSDYFSRSTIGLDSTRAV